MRNRKYIGTILVDMDDVLAEMLTVWIGKYNELYGDSLEAKNIKDWDTSKFVKPECGTKVYDLFKYPGLFRFLKPKPESTEVIRRLTDNGFEIVIVSDSPAGDSYSDYLLDNSKVSNPADDKRKWLQEHFPMISSDNVVFTSQKWRVSGDVLIDDKPETFEIFKSKGRTCLLMDMPYNQYIQTENRVHNLLEAEQWIYKKFDIKEKNEKIPKVKFSLV